ncbi:MAG: AAA family ATPase [Bacteroidales bacterium]|nr:AAA family ATPase [Bacteroidales bacterium]
MDYNDFTKVAQNALRKGTDIAKVLKHTHIENIHILKGIIETDNNVTPFIFRRLGIKISEFENNLVEIYKNFDILKENEKLKISKNVDKSLNKAKQISKSLKDDYISIEHILSGILLTGDISSNLMLKKGFNQEMIESAIKELRKNPIKKEDTTEKFETLNKYAVNMINKIKSGKSDPIIGRIDEIRRVLQIISRKTKNNPIIIGEPGVGKTAIVEGLAQRIVKGDVPENLKNNIIFSLDLGSIIAGASKQGELESRLKSIIKEVNESAGEVILFIDEIHLLVGTGKSGGKPGAADILKPALARGELRAIGATTINEYKKYFEKDKALDRRFQKIIVEEPSIDDCISILRGIKEKYQTFHKVRIKDEAVIAAVELSDRYISDRFLPDKAIDLMDEASSKLRLEINTLPSEIDELERKIIILKTEKAQLKKEDNETAVKELSNKISDLSDKCTNYRAIWESEKTLINEIISKRKLIADYKIQAEKSKEEGDFETAAKITYKDIEDEKKLLENLNNELDKNRSEVILSKEFVDRELIAELISDITGIPVSKMTKSESEKLINLEKELGKRVIGQKEAIRAVSEAVRRSRAGLQDKGKPIGSFIFLGTTGVGKTELAKALAEFLFDDEKNIVRIDMSEYQEKHTVSRLIGSPPGYVGYDEGGQLTEAVRMKPYSVVLLDEIEKAHKDIFNTFLQVLDDGHLTDSQGRTVNFKNTLIIMTSNAGSDKINKSFEKMTSSNYKEVIIKTKQEVSQVLKETMRPEFLNRIDEIIMFMPLSLNSISKIVELQLNSLKKKLKKDDIRINFTKKAVSVLSRLSYNPQFGARPVKRTIQKHILNELSEQILKNEVDKKKIINIDLKDSKLIFNNVTDQELEKILADQKLVTDKKEKHETETDTENETTIKKDSGFWKRFGNWFKNIFGNK